ncbi:hypothetical protein M2451_002028 [Dysgonomonas sp. PFB1-18]|uniref:hypothetical protein n=1 Tax=unclassified Dysgonomonas TaxID=2630389 RepID=UPI002476D8CA|nr:MULTISPECIES: hypothetical protein [unclassified Dysgonomonas]MDH6309788.1 hypothetical protein [Dysgonomonas sp. PF1-14]MDH6339204.1 hypothetical protein [Dysgonomonas sp. PF1-16]MDH6380703.1 hypothetical protein [Dysgonomonas sp. PFB1-18]MDH6398199.1 hypothetical protein [Dysgonomonas sp. PF1-23]
MKTVVKYLALMAIIAVALKSFIDAFTPEYEAWREKYPPEPEEDEEDAGEALGNVVQASDLFKPDAQAFISEGKEG